MIGAYTIGKKAVQFGYKRYGIPGAIATGGAALAGYLIVRRALKSSTNGGNVDSAIDAGEIQSAVEEKGLSAVTDTGTLERAINEEEVGSAVTWTTSSRRPKRRPTSSPTTRETATRAPIADRTPDHPSRDVCHPPVASHHRPDVFRAVTAFSLLDRQPVTDRNSQPEYEQARSHHRNRRQSRDRIRTQRIETQPRVRLEGAPVRPRGIESGLPAGIGGGVSPPPRRPSAPPGRARARRRPTRSGRRTPRGRNRPATVGRETERSPESTSIRRTSSAPRPRSATSRTETPAAAGIPVTRPGASPGPASTSRDVDSSPDLESDIDATGIDQSDVVETGTDEERLADVANESTVPDSESDGLESEPDVPESESAITESKSESSDSAGGVSDSPDSAETEATESYERLGSASFDEHSGEIPVPSARSINTSCRSDPKRSGDPRGGRRRLRLTGIRPDSGRWRNPLRREYRDRRRANPDDSRHCPESLGFRRGRRNGRRLRRRNRVRHRRLATGRQSDTSRPGVGSTTCSRTASSAERRARRIGVI